MRAWPPHSTMSPKAGDIHVHLAEVEFCDLAGLRAFVLLSQTRHPGHDHHHQRVTLHHLPASLQALLQILGWDSTPGLLIEESPDTRHADDAHGTS